MNSIQNQRLCSPFRRVNSDQKTILYIETDPVSVFLVEKLIERRSDLNLFVATGAFAGIGMAQDLKPDLIVIEIDLPDLNGFDAFTILRTDPKTAHTPVIAVTSDPTPAQIQKGIQAGFRNYISKPYDLVAFMKQLDANLYFSLRIDAEK